MITASESSRVFFRALIFLCTLTHLLFFLLLFFPVTSTGFDGVSNLNTSQQSKFVLQDLRLGNATTSYQDPELDPGTGRVVYVDEAGTIHGAWLDPITGEFDTTRPGVILSTQAATVTQALNGPEWAYSLSGTSVVFTKQNGNSLQPWVMPWNVTPGMAVPQFSGSAPRLASLGSRNPFAVTPRILFSKFSPINGGIQWADVGNPGVENPIPNVQAGVSGPRFLPNSQDLIFSQLVNGIGQIARFNTTTQQSTVLTNSLENLSDPFGWFAPEVNGDLLYFAIINQQSLGIFQHQEGTEIVEQTALLTIPEESHYKYLYSAEPIVFGGKSYITLHLQETNVTPSTHENASVWIWDLNPDPETRLARRLDSGGGGTRLDPESFAGTQELFVLYNLINEEGTWEVHRCTTGITLPISTVDCWLLN